MGLAKHGKVPPPFPPHVAKDVDEARALHDLVQEQGRDGAQASCRARGRSRGSRTLAERRGARSATATRLVPAAVRCRASVETEAQRGGRREARRVLQGLPRVALGEGARHSTQALAPKVGLELIELEAVTCCGAGDIHEAEPDYYLHLNARILAYAEATGVDTLMTICNVCTLNLRQANYMLQGDAALRARVNENLVTVGVPRVRGRGRGQALPLADRRGRGLRAAAGAAHKGLKGLKIAPFYGCQILRPSKLLGFEDPDRPVVARADHRRLRRRGGRLPGEDQVLRLPDHPGTRGDARSAS